MGSTLREWAGLGVCLTNLPDRVKRKADNFPPKIVGYDHLPG
jgi:hypothetical protein